MGKYDFLMPCIPQRRLRIDDALHFLRLMKKAFSVNRWIGVDDAELELTRAAVQRAFEASDKPEEIKRFGAQLTVKSDCAVKPVILMIASGGDQWAYNCFRADFTRKDYVPDLNYLKQSINAIRPYEAYIADAENSKYWIDIQQPASKPRRGMSLPSWLHWLDYWSAPVVEQLGGRALA